MVRPSGRPTRPGTRSECSLLAEPLTPQRPLLIAGGGIAGLTLAIALAKRGIASHVLERRNESAEAGAGIQIGPNGMHVLAGLGVTEQLAAVAARPRAIVVNDGASGRRLAELPLGDAIAARHGAPYLVAHRADLHAVLLEAARAAPLIAITTGAEVVGVDGYADGVAVTTAAKGRFDGLALIGCDGIWSAVRRKLFPDFALAYAGKMAARTVIPAAAASGWQGQPLTGVWLSPDAHVVHYPVRAGAEIAVVVVLDEPRPREGWGSEIANDDVLRKLAAFTPDLRAFLANGESWRAWSLYDPAPLPAWSLGRLALSGDAAHPILPFLAQGGVMAIEDAVVLAEALTRTPADPSTAFRAFEAARRRRVERVQAASRQNGVVFHLVGPMGLARNAALALLPGGVFMSRYDWLYGWKGEKVG